MKSYSADYGNERFKNRAIFGIVYQLEFRISLRMAIIDGSVQTIFLSKENGLIALISNRTVSVEDQLRKSCKYIAGALPDDRDERMAVISIESSTTIAAQVESPLARTTSGNSQMKISKRRDHEISTLCLYTLELSLRIKLAIRMTTF